MPMSSIASKTKARRARNGPQQGDVAIASDRGCRCTESICIAGTVGTAFSSRATWSTSRQTFLRTNSPAAQHAQKHGVALKFLTSRP